MSDKTLRIGIDARFLTHPQAGGFKTYTTNLIEALLQEDVKNQYFIYLDRPPSGELWQQDNVTYRVVNGYLPGFSMPIREQVFLRRQARMDKVDLLHFLCNTAAINLNFPFIVTLHDTIQLTSGDRFTLRGDFHFYKNWLVNQYSGWAIRKTAGKAKKIVTVSKYEKGQISHDLKLPEERISVTHLAPNKIFREASQEKKLEWRNEIGQKYHICRKFVLGVGYEPRKNIPLLIRAFSKIAADLPDLDLVIVAAQEAARQVFSNLVADLGVASRVILLPGVGPDELLMLYNLAEVFVFPSRRESFGLPPLEAIACGTVSIAMRATSLPEILSDGAILVDGEDVEIWSVAIRNLLADPEMCSKLQAQGLRRAKELSWQKCARETIKVYREAVDI